MPLSIYHHLFIAAVAQPLLGTNTDLVRLCPGDVLYTLLGINIQRHG